MRNRSVNKAFGDWAQSIRNKAPNAGTAGQTGGFLIPEGLVVGLDSAIREESFFHQYAAFQPMNERTVGYPTVDPAGATGLSPLLGGFQMRWGSEGAEPTNANPAFSKVTLVAKELQGVGYISKQLFMDGGEVLGAYLTDLYAKAVAFMITYAGFRGSGAAQPLGILNSPGIALVTRAGGGAIIGTDAEGMLAKLLPACYPHCWWACSSSAFGDLSSISGYTSVVYPGPDGSLQTMGVFRGRPVLVTECLPELGTQGDLVLFDPRAYVLGERLTIEVAFSDLEPDAWNTYQVASRVWWRGDGSPLFQETMTLANSGTGFSPYVVLN